MLAGYEVGDATLGAAPRRAVHDAAAPRPRPRCASRCRADNALDADVDPECLRGDARDRATLLAALGHEIEEASPGAARARTRCGCSPASFGPAIALEITYGAAAGRPRRRRTDEIEPLSRALAELARRHDARSSTSPAVAQLQALARGVVAFFAEYDVLLTPALAERPLPIGELDGSARTRWRDFARSGRFTPFTALFNVTGQPAISIPAGFGDDGLPTDAQLVGQAAGRGHAARRSPRSSRRAAAAGARGTTGPEARRR